MTNRSVPRVHLVGPLDVVSPDEYVAVAVAAARGGVDAVHVRLPGRPAAEVLDGARRMRAALPAATAVVVNDRLDVALAAPADGVQLGERSLPVVDARAIGGRLLIGRSVHDVDAARRAAADGADFLLAGHVYPTASHAGEPGRGTTWLAEMCAAVAIPVIAIGGITAARVAEVREAGAWGVALGRDILRADDPESAARRVVARVAAARRIAQ